MKNLILTIFLLQISFSTQAGCLDKLRQILEWANPTLVISQEHRDEIDARLTKFKNRLTNTVSPPYGKLDKYQRMRIETYLKKEGIPIANKEVLQTIIEAYNKPENFQSWMRDLIDHLIDYTATKGNRFQKLRLMNEREFSPLLMADLLLVRLKPTGLNTKKYFIIKDLLQTTEFLELLKNRRVLQDRAFESASHGEMIHTYQFDYIRFLLKERGIPESYFGDFIQWVGEGKSVDIGQPGNPLNMTMDIWDKLFDGFGSSLHRPEQLNPKIQQALEIYSFSRGLF